MWFRGEVIGGRVFVRGDEREGRRLYLRSGWFGSWSLVSLEILIFVFLGEIEGRNRDFVEMC